MLIASIALIIGFIALVWSADKFVYGASNTAASFNVSPLVVGVVIVGLGTSAPEMLVSSMAAFSGNSGLSIGNAIGSNITNVGLILGLTALYLPLTVRSGIVKKELPLMVFVLFAASTLLIDLSLSFLDGILLLAGFVALIAWSLKAAMNKPEDILSNEFDNNSVEKPSRVMAVFWLIFGMLILVASSRLLVWGAVNIATELGVSDLIIGLTIVAIGTSLPELAATIAAARKQEYDIAIGNVLGSNMFNLLGVMALPAIIAPGSIESAVLWRDIPFMLVLAVLLWMFSSNFTFTKQGILSKAQGFVLLAIYLTYLGLLIHSSLNAMPAIAQ